MEVGLGGEVSRRFRPVRGQMESKEKQARAHTRRLLRKALLTNLQQKGNDRRARPGTTNVSSTTTTSSDTRSGQVVKSDGGVKKKRKCRPSSFTKLKAAMQRPSLFLEDKNVVWSASSKQTTLFVFELQHLLIFGLLGDAGSFKPRYCRLLRQSKIKQFLVVVIKDVSLDDYRDHPECFTFMKKAFTMEVPMLNPAQYGRNVMEEICQVPLSARQKKLSGDNGTNKLCLDIPRHQPFVVHLQQININMTLQQNQSETEKDSTNSRASGCLDTFTRLKLLLNVRQMIEEAYPVPFLEGQYSNYVFTKDKYERVTESSPMFAIDCEMCSTKTRKHELTWIAVVDEQHKVVYKSFVQPPDKVTDYLTRYSGVTENMLVGVTTTLGDVQQALRRLLPPDAILCGHSFENDLTAMQMFHPYVIDTSTIFNHSGSRNYKPPLKGLIKHYFGETIQDNLLGHDPAEDAMASMKLVQQKLRHGLAYGDVISGFVPAPYKQLKDDRSGNADKLEQQKAFYDRPGLDLFYSLFDLTRGTQKSVLFLDTDADLAPYKHLVDSPVESSSDKDRVSQACSLMPQHFVTFVQLHGSSKTSEDGDKTKKKLSKLDKRVEKLLAATSGDCLVTVVLSGRMESGDPQKALTLLKLTVK